MTYIKTRSLVESVGAWLFFEYKCFRGILFNERYLSFPIGQFLKARYDHYVRTEYEHPILSKTRTGRGDKPRIDYVILDDEERIKIAIETKWLSGGTKAITSIIRDLIRLELMSNYGATSIFLIAGRKRDFLELFESSQFQGDPGHDSSHPLLPYNHNGQRVLRFFPTPDYRTRVFKRVLKDFEGVEIAEALKLTRALPFPRDLPTYQYVVYGWLISAYSPNRRTFKPGNSDV